MKFNAKHGSWQLEDSDAAMIKGMLARGDKQHNIAAFFGVNAGRIAEIATEARFAEVAPAGAYDLPPVAAVQHLMAPLLRALARTNEQIVLNALEPLAE